MTRAADQMAPRVAETGVGGECGAVAGGDLPERWWTSESCNAINFPPEVVDVEAAVSNYAVMRAMHGTHVRRIGPEEPSFAEAVEAVFPRIACMPPGGWVLVDATKGEIVGPRGTWALRFFLANAEAAR